MSIFKSIRKGIKSFFKGIGKRLKSAFKRFGKFMNKIGVLGQIGLMFILPGVGNMIASAWSGVAGQTAAQATASAAGQVTASAAAEAGSTVAQATAKGLAKETATKAAIKAGTEVATKKATGLMAGGNFSQGVGKLMQFTGKVVGTPGRVFSNITQGITDTLGNFAKTASNNIFGTKFTTAAGNSLNGKFFGPGDSAFGQSFGNTSKFANVLAKSPTIATKQAASNFQATANSLAKLPQSSLNTEGLPSNMSPRQDAAFKLQEKTFGRRGNTMNVGEGMKDLSQYKPFDANDPFLTASTKAPTTSQINAVTAEQKALGLTGEQPTQMQKLTEQNAQSVVPRVGDAVAPPVSKSSLLDPVAVDSLNIVPLDDFTKPVMNMKGVGDAPNIDAAAVEVEEVVKPSLLENIKTGITGAPKRVMDKATDIAKDPLGYAFKGFEDSLQQGIQYKAKEALGLTPDMPDQYVTNTRAYVPSFDTGGGAGSYQAPETMDARAFEQNVLAAPSQYGYTAFQYDQYMNRTAQA